MYSFLSKIFTKLNKDGLVNRESFFKLVDMAACILRMYGHVTTDVELYKTEDKKEQAKKKMFDLMDFKEIDVIAGILCQVDSPGNPKFWII